LVITYNIAESFFVKLVLVSKNYAVRKIKLCFRMFCLTPTTFYTSMYLHPDHSTAVIFALDLMGKKLVKISTTLVGTGKVSFYD